MSYLYYSMCSFNNPEAHLFLLDVTFGCGTYEQSFKHIKPHSLCHSSHVSDAMFVIMPTSEIKLFSPSSSHYTNLKNGFSTFLQAISGSQYLTF